MSDLISLYPNSKFGYQIISKGNNKTKQLFNVGLATAFPYELRLHCSDAVISADQPRVNSCSYCFTFLNKPPEPSMAAELIDIPDNTVLIRYSKELLSVLTLRKSLDLKSFLFSQFRQSFHNQIIPRPALLPERLQQIHYSVVEEIEMGLPSSGRINRYISALSELVMTENPDGEAFFPGNPFRRKMETLIKFIIETNFQYPLPDDFRRVTGITKSAFQKSIKARTGTTLKHYIDELVFRSGMHAIIYTHKSNTEIASDHGYSELSAFSRQIKKRAGYSPLNIRNLCEGNVLKLMPQ